MLVPFVILQSWLVASAQAARTRGHSDRLAGDTGQTTAAYALVLIGAAAIAVLLITWATKTDVIGKLFSFVLDRVQGKAG